ncbi:rRNA-processing protein CGR1-like [Miscanthus floridulus]|uniref:rRNA-processing protein CGR1-like n=1 Tax=Miscanthus floridulus TaxID=154761 RepID=UPI003457548D
MAAGLLRSGFFGVAGVALAGDGAAAPANLPATAVCGTCAGALTPPPLCDFKQWIDTEIKSEDKEWMQKLLRWEAEDKELIERRHKEVAVEKEHKEEEKRRRVAAYREEREKKLERARREKAAMEENPDALRKEK